MSSLKTQNPKLKTQNSKARRPSTKFKSSPCETAVSAGATCTPSEANSPSPRTALQCDLGLEIVREIVVVQLKAERKAELRTGFLHPVIV